MQSYQSSNGVSYRTSQLQSPAQSRTDVSYRPLQSQPQFPGFNSAPAVPLEPRANGEEEQDVEDDDDDEDSELLTELKEKAFERKNNLQIHKTRPPSEEEIKRYLNDVDAAQFPAGFQRSGPSREFASKISTNERYSMWCSSRDIGKEIGATFTFFFTFLRLLIALMLIYWVLLLPLYILSLYVGSTHPGLISEWNNVVTDACKCSGDNHGFTRLANVPDYGERCAPWDDGEVCDNMDTHKADLVGLAPGSWCCKSWCYVYADCLVAHRSWGTGDDGEPLYYRYKQCEKQEDPAVIASCQYPDLAKSPETSGNGTRQFEMIGPWIGSTGNLGYENDKFALWGPRLGCIALVLLVLITMVSLVRFRKYQDDYFDEIEAEEIIHDPSDWALLVDGLPKDHSVTEKQVNDFIRCHALPGREVEVVKVVMVYDVAGFEHLINSRKSLRKSLEIAAPDDYHDEETFMKKIATNFRKKDGDIRSEIKSVDKSLAEAFGSKDPPSFSGWAVVSVRYRRDARQILQRWHNPWTMAGDPIGIIMWFVKKVCPSWAPDTPRFVWEDDEYVLDISKAPNPGDFIFENAGVNPICRMINYSLSLFLLFLLLLANLFALWGLGLWEQKLQKEQTDMVTGKVQISVGNRCVAALPSMFTVVVNASLTYVITDLVGPNMKRLTRSGVEGGIAFLLSTALVISTSLSKLCVLDQPVEWYRQGGLAEDVMYLMMTQGAQSVVMIGFDTTYVMKRFIAKFLVDPGFLEVTKEQYLNLYEPAGPELYRWYPYCINIFFLCAIFCPIVPIAPLIGAVILSLCYAAAKFRMLNLCSRPKHEVNSQMDKIMQDYLQNVLIMVPLSAAWILPTFSGTKRTVVIVAWVCSFLGLVFICLPKTWIFSKLGWFDTFDTVTVRGLSRDDFETAMDDYFCVQHLWSARMKYHKAYFFMRGLPPEVNPEILHRPGVSRSLSTQSQDNSDKPVIELLQEHKDEVAAAGIGDD